MGMSVPTIESPYLRRDNTVNWNRKDNLDSLVRSSFYDSTEKFPLSENYFIDIGAAVDVHDMNDVSEHFGRILRLYGIHISSPTMPSFDFVVAMEFLGWRMISLEEMGLDMFLDCFG